MGRTPDEPERCSGRARLAGHPSLPPAPTGFHDGRPDCSLPSREWGCILFQLPRDLVQKLSSGSKAGDTTGTQHPGPKPIISLLDLCGATHPQGQLLPDQRAEHGHPGMPALRATRQRESPRILLRLHSIGTARLEYFGLIHLARASKPKEDRVQIFSSFKNKIK